MAEHDDGVSEDFKKKVEELYDSLNRKIKEATRYGRWLVKYARKI
ncbi:hypothetical protein V7114_23660 [Neobacillus niacini]